MAKKEKNNEKYEVVESTQVVEIHKRNELVRGNVGSTSVYTPRLLNAFYFLVQKGQLYSEEWQEVDFSTLRKLMNLDKTNVYVDLITQALTDLAKPIPLYNYTDTNGKTYAYYQMRFLHDSRVDKDSQWKVRYKIYPEMLAIMQIARKEGNFTKLEILNILNNFRSKYTMKLYEYLFSFRGMGSHMIILEKLRGIMDSKKSFSEILRIVDRCEKEIRTKDPYFLGVTRNVDKKNKIITYYFPKIDKDKANEPKKLSLKEFIVQVKKDYLGSPFIKPYKLGMNYRPATTFSIDKESQLVQNDVSGKIVESKIAEDVFAKLYKQPEALGDVKEDVNDYINETFTVLQKRRDALGTVQNISTKYKILEIKNLGDNKGYKIKLENENGRAGWSSKIYPSSQELIRIIKERL